MLRLWGHHAGIIATVVMEEVIMTKVTRMRRSIVD